MYRRRLFKIRHPYDVKKSDKLFYKAIKENIIYHYKNTEYKEILDNLNFSMEDFLSIDDLEKIPPIPTTYLKRHNLFTKPYEKCKIKSETSGTSSGIPSRVGLDLSTCLNGLRMLIRMVRVHKLISLKRTNYIILGYEPNKKNKMGAVKTAYGATYLAPAKSRTYALKYVNDEYILNIDEIKKNLLRFSNTRKPVRLIGFPAYMFFLIEELEKEGIALKLHKKSKVLLGGGWKQFLSEKVEKKELYLMIEKVLGIPEKNIKELFGVVEHNIPYFDCANHHFHIPAYARVIIRDPKTLKPVLNGVPGLLNLITPMLTSMPLLSVITDDIAIKYDGCECGCGNEAPYFVILGRAGMSDIKTCVNEAADMIGRTIT